MWPAARASRTQATSPKGETTQVRSPSRTGTIRVVAVSVSAIAVVVAVAADASQARAAVEQAWPPFVLVAGLLAVGAVAQATGLFDAVGHRMGGLRGSHAISLCGVLLLVAATTAVLNLHTAAAFLTPIAVAAARRRGVREDAFLYGTLFMTNAASLVLPGSNLTNLLVLGHGQVSGAEFASRMWPGSLAAVVVTIGVVVVWRWPDLREPRGCIVDGDPPVSGIGVLVVAAVAVAVVATRAPAVPVLLLAVTTSALAVAIGQLSWRRILDAVDPLVLVALFGMAVVLGTVARSWDGPARLLESSHRAVTVAVAALATVPFNNLPAAALLSAGDVAHPRALLLGLNLGPNLAVTGSLSAFVWIKAARAAGAAPDWRRVSRVGLVLVPLTVTAAAAGLWLLAPGAR